MRVTTNFVRLALFAALLGCMPRAACGQAGTVQKLLRDHYPGHHLLRLDERDADTRAFLLKHFKGSDPSVVHADFDGDGHLDYAMLLKSDTSAAAKLVVLLCDAPGRCRGVYELDITGYSEEVYLSLLPPGSRVVESESVESKNQSSPVNLTNAGIQLNYFESDTVALYWDKKLKKIVAVGTSD